MSDNKNYAAAGLVETAKNEEKPNQHVDQLITLALDESYGPSALSYWMDETKNARFVLNEQFIRRALKDKPQVAQLLVVSWTDSVSKFSAEQFELIIGGQFLTFQNAVTKPDELRSKLCDSVRTNGVTTFINAADNFISNLNVNVPIVEGDIMHLLREYNDGFIANHPELNGPIFDRRSISENVLSRLKVLPKYFKADNNPVIERDSLPIFRISAMSGQGKSLISYHLQEFLLNACCKESEKSQSHSNLHLLLEDSLTVYIEFNGGGDKLDNEWDPNDSNKFFFPRLVARGLLRRSLQAARIGEKKFIFDKFLHSTKEDETTVIRRVFQQHRERTGNLDRPVCMFVIFDEYQKVLQFYNDGNIPRSAQERGDKPSYKSEYFKDVLRQLVENSKNKIYGINNFVLPFAVGTNLAGLPVDNPASNHPLINLSMDTVTLDDSFDLMPKLHNSWKNNEYFLRILSCFGGNPRMIKLFYDKCEELLSMQIPENLSEYESVTSKIRDLLFKSFLDVYNVSTFQHMTADSLVDFLTIALLQIPIPGNYTFKLSANATLSRSAKVKDEINLDELLTTGCMTVTPTVNSWNYPEPNPVTISSPIFVMSRIAKEAPEWLKSAFVFPPARDIKTPADNKSSENFERLFFASLFARLLRLQKERKEQNTFQLKDLLGHIVNLQNHVFDTLYTLPELSLTPHVEGSCYIQIHNEGMAMKKVSIPSKETTELVEAAGAANIEIKSEKKTVRVVKVKTEITLTADGTDVTTMTDFLKNTPQALFEGPLALFCAPGNALVDMRFILKPKKSESRPLMLLIQLKESYGSLDYLKTLRYDGLEAIRVHRNIFGNVYDFVFLGVCTNPKIKELGNGAIAPLVEVMKANDRATKMIDPDDSMVLFMGAKALQFSAPTYYGAISYRQTKSLR